MLMVNDNVCLWTTILQSSVTYTVAVEGLRFYIITIPSNVNICIMLVTCHLFLGRSTSSHTLSPAVFHNPFPPASLSPHFCFAFTTSSTASCFRAILTSSFLTRSSHLTLALSWGISLPTLTACSHVISAWSMAHVRPALWGEQWTDTADFQETKEKQFVDQHI